MLEITFDETYKDSREITYDKDNISQTIVGTICGNFFEVANQNQAGLYDDDTYVMQAAFAVLPISYEVPNYIGASIVLVLATIRLKQMSDDTWQLTATYDMPNDGGERGGGMGTSNIGNVGPGAGENNGQGWSENFTQISVNGGVSTRNRKWSRGAVVCHRSINIPAGDVPYPPGKPAPIGHTNDGIEGVDVYEREFSFGITAYFPPQKLRYAYVRKLSRMQTSMNKQVFFGFPPGTVLFLEWEASSDLHQVVPVTFQFKQRNRFQFKQSTATGQDILADPSVDDSWDVLLEPDFPDTIVFPGWDEVDYRYAPVPDTGAVMVLQRPIIRTIHRLYEFSNFSALEL